MICKKLHPNIHILYKYSDDIYIYTINNKNGMSSKFLKQPLKNVSFAIFTDMK